MLNFKIYSCKISFVTANGLWVSSHDTQMCPNDGVERRIKISPWCKSCLEIEYKVQTFKKTCMSSLRLRGIYGSSL